MRTKKPGTKKRKPAPEPKCVISVIYGDGIGPEVVSAAINALNVFGRFEWRSVDIGKGREIPTGVLRKLQSSNAVLKGPTETPIGTGHKSMNVLLREELKLYACVRPVRWFPGLPSPLRNPEGIDITVIRENLEDVYAGLEVNLGDGEERRLFDFRKLADIFGSFTRIPQDARVALKIISPNRTCNLMRFAFTWARAHGRKKLTCVHKGNILKLTDGYFAGMFREIHKDFPEFEIESLLADNAAQQLLLRPQSFDVLVCVNLYGDILSDLAAALVGGVGIAAGANYGRIVSVFEATHGTWPEGAGQNRANPAAMILSGAMMLEHLGMKREAEIVRDAVQDAIASGVGTEDMKCPATVGTREFGNEVRDRVRTLLAERSAQNE